MRIVKILLIGIIVSVFLVGQAYSAPKGNNGKANNGNANNGNANNGNSQAVKVNKGNNKAVAQNRGQAAVHKQQARRSSEANRKREERNRSSDRKPFLSKGNSDLAFNDNAQRVNNVRRNGKEMKDERVLPALDLINSLNRARWWQNPHDTRGQGNMGKVDMQDPFGHDRDSDRKELYGNNGRPIRINEEEEPEVVEELPVEEEIPEVVEDLPAEELPVEEEIPEIVEELPAEELPTEEELALLDASIDFSSIDDMQWLVNWYESAVASYYGSDYAQDYYTYEEWDRMWYNHFFPEGDLSATTGIRVNNIGDESERYDYDITLNEFEGDSIIVTTTLTSVETGEILYEQTEEASVDSATDTVTIGISATDDLIESTIYTAVEYVELEVTITDSSTGETYTQTYDKSLYLYRCPYGKLTNERTGQAIVNAKITVHFEDGSIVSLDKATNKTASNPQITDATGRFGFILQSNRKYYMTAKAEGYEDYQSEIFTEQWHVLREDIEMVPVQEQMASN